ncbi:MAG TPA: TlpA disulfide reductase family protein [Methylomirabilota bacterium]|nr:TlpA disulfide reductase family protein [Methylomirabilota bacterium]
MTPRGLWAILTLVAIATGIGIPPAPAQIDDEDERQREQARDRDIQRQVPPWLYDLYRKDRERDRPKEKTELDKLVEQARLYPLIGREPPPFSLLRLDGRRVALSDFTGHVVVLYFWTTASSYGADELSSRMEKMQREWRDRKFTVLAVNVKEKKEEVAPWVQKRLLSPVVLLDTDGGVSQDYRVRAIPTVYVIGRDMRLVGRASGTRAWDEGPEKALLDYLVKAPAS